MFRNWIHYNIICLGLLLGASSLTAQVFPPDFICVKSDTLIWNLPNNTCGAFNNYTVFVSNDEAGPYEILTTITDPDQTIFVHEESVTARFFYYLQSNFDCPNEPILSSDTLDNRLPEPVVISSVSVESNNVTIDWSVNASPDVVEYVVYRITPMGTTPIATVTDQLFYIDTEAAPNQQQEFYYVLAGDACGSTSIFPDPQGTILMELTGGNVCERNLELNWNIYENWTNPIQRHEIWVSINGGTAERVDTVAGNIDSYLFTEVNDEAEYCFFIQAVEDETNNQSASNQVCIGADIVRPNQELFLKTVSVNADNQVELNWQWNTDAEINQSQILRSIDEVDFTSIDTQIQDPPLSLNPTFIDEEAEVNNSVFHYQISTLDDCEVAVNSNQISTILMSVIEQNNQFNLLNWTTPDWANGTVQSYELYKIINNEPTYIDLINPPVNTYQDPVDINNLAAANAQYYLLINISITLPNGNIETVQVRSNTVTLAPFATVLTPNAFAPNGQNQEFRPVISFGENADYQLLIYDRYGGIVFETRDIKQGWNGRDQTGKLRSGGIYIYHVRIIQPDGSITQDQGTVMLLL